eukprot:Sdes_comp21757_c0_seq1m20328
MVKGIHSIRIVNDISSLPALTSSHLSSPSTSSCHVAQSFPPLSLTLTSTCSKPTLPPPDAPHKRPLTCSFISAAGPTMKLSPPFPAVASEMSLQRAKDSIQSSLLKRRVKCELAHELSQDMAR